MLTRCCTNGEDQGGPHLAELLDLDKQEERQGQRDSRCKEWDIVIVPLALSAHVRNHCLFSKNFLLMHCIEFPSEQKSTQGFQARPFLSLL